MKRPGQTIPRAEGGCVDAPAGGRGSGGESVRAGSLLPAGSAPPALLLMSTLSTSEQPNEAVTKLYYYSLQLARIREKSHLKRHEEPCGAAPGRRWPSSEERGAVCRQRERLLGTVRAAAGQLGHTRRRPQRGDSPHQARGSPGKTRGPCFL